ncbi:MAG: AAA family ATPase, partial [Planctomycetaceae bacterium]
MWLQLVWFLSRVPEHATVVLDEPDVYVHPRQQCSLMEILRRRSAQTILATHSPTIISQSTPDELLRVHRATAESQPGLSESQHQQQIAGAL